jgi:hypothetical protein
MKQTITTVMLASILGAIPALACEYKAGETKYVDYAHCLYGTDEVRVVDLPDGSKWEQCIYRTQAFMPPKLLAITRENGGQEEAVANFRGAIGNPCYLMKKACDEALEAQQD